MRSLLYLPIILALLNGCLLQKDTPLSYALEAAGENRYELEKVLAHYKNDSLKQEAARFLIQNMVYHHTFCEEIVSSEGQRYELNYGDYPSKQALNRGLDSLYSRGYRLEKQVLWDIETVKSDYLIENIELAFQVWRRPWAERVSFSDFCRYILPYRSLYEIPGSVRKEIMERYLPVLDSLRVETSLEAGIVIHRMMRDKFKFLELNPAVYPSADNVYTYGYAKCDGLALASVFAMRALGIPASIEHTIWSKRNGDHYWCTLFSEGRSYPYAPEHEAPDGEIVRNLATHFLTPPKVYRYEFAPEKEFRPDPADDGYRSFLKNPLLSDVTGEYLAPVADIVVLANKEAYKTDSPIYLCVYNNKRWRLLAMGRRDGDRCLFEDVIKNDVFIVADSPDGKGLRYITNPFYVDREGEILLFDTDTVEKGLLIVENSKDYANIPETLQIWDNRASGFRNFSFTVDSVSNKPYCYYEVPSNALFRATIAADSKYGGERVFFVENNKIRLY